MTKLESSTIRRKCRHCAGTGQVIIHAMTIRPCLRCGGKGYTLEVRLPRRQAGRMDIVPLVCVAAVAFVAVLLLGITGIVIDSQPRPGQTWVMDLGPEDPFEPRDIYTNVVLEVRGKYVLYYHPNNHLTNHMLLWEFKEWGRRIN